MTFTGAGWGMVFALAAVGLASGLDADTAFERAVAWLKENERVWPTDESARAVFDLMRRP